MIVSEAALKVLREGGNAVDAAITAAFLQQVTEPHQVSAWGALSGLYYDAETGQYYAYNGDGELPLSTRSSGRSHNPEISSRVSIGGTVLSLWELHGRFGTDGYRYEQVLGDKGRSGGQWAIWQAVFSSIGPDGYPTPLWDSITGKIYHEVAEFWRENYDLSAIIRRDWTEKGPDLRGKLHFAVGMMDNYYLNEAVYLIQDVLESQTDPPAEASFQYGFRGRHSWIGHSPQEPKREMTYAEFISVIAQYITSRAPVGADTKSWKE